MALTVLYQSFDFSLSSWLRTYVLQWALLIFSIN